MIRRTRFVAAHLALTLLASGCQTGSPAGTAAKPSEALARPAASAVVAAGRSMLAVRLLAQGTFTLPATLVSVGAGSLVSVGSGNIVSVGSGGLVSVGSAHFRTMALGQQPVANARIALLAASGLDTGINAQTDGAGHFALTGDLPSGLYRLAAGQIGKQFQTLASIGQGPADAPIDLASTLVSARLLAEHTGSDMTVLPTEAYNATMAAVREALAPTDLPTGWSPEQSEATLAKLEAAHPEIRNAMATLHSQQAALEHRAANYPYSVQAMASALGLPLPQVSGAVMAALSANPAASDDEIKQVVIAQAPLASSGRASTPANMNSGPGTSTSPVLAAPGGSAAEGSAAGNTAAPPTSAGAGSLAAPALQPPVDGGPKTAVRGVAGPAPVAPVLGVNVAPGLAISQSAAGETLGFPISGFNASSVVGSTVTTGEAPASHSPVSPTAPAAPTAPAVVAPADVAPIIGIGGGGFGTINVGANSGQTQALSDRGVNAGQAGDFTDAANGKVGKAGQRTEQGQSSESKADQNKSNEQDQKGHNGEGHLVVKVSSDTGPASRQGKKQK